MAGLKPKPNKTAADPAAPKPEDNNATAMTNQAAPANQSESLAPEIDEDEELHAGEGEELELRTNPKVEREIADYKAAYPKSVDYFTRLVKEHPERAVNFHFRKLQQNAQAQQQRALRQLPEMQRIFMGMSSEAQARIQDKLKTATKYSYTQRFVRAVRREMNARYPVNQAPVQKVAEPPALTPPAAHAPKIAV